MKTTAASNKSMDVRAKQLLSYLACPLNFTLSLAGFAPRHLNRYASMVNSNERLLKAASEGDSELLKLALAEGADIDAANDFGSSALICAATKGHLEIIRLLLANGANINHRSQYEISALQQAVSWQHFEAVQTLLDYGADVNERGNVGTTPLMIAAARGNMMITRLLLERGAVPDQRDLEGLNAWVVRLKKEILKLLNC
ncbi:MAG TPA: ankyrin repeat domain-containing protein [Pyrinomonadaceae bacterium]|nr:ankyrin repeat domain-containing protein [Pyrinomonadaceae bacterium]